MKKKCQLISFFFSFSLLFLLVYYQMENSESSFQLWSPPTLDLSLDSFSTEILSQFDKNGQEINKHPIEPEVLKSQMEQNKSSFSYDTRLSSTIERGMTPSLMDEVESSSTINLFRRSSTFLRSKLSVCSKRNSEEIGSDLKLSSVSIVVENTSTRPYPPKPLEYSPVIELPSANFESIDSVSIVSSHEEEATETDIDPSKREYLTVEVDSDRESLDSSSVVTKESEMEQQNDQERVYAEKKESSESIKAAPHFVKGVCINQQQTTPKRRSIFFFRFC